MSPYEILGVAGSASDAELKTAYRALRSKFHPDKGGDRVMFDAVQKAYDALQNRRCPVCDNKGRIRERNGAFSKEVNCPRCWGKD